MGSSNVKFLLQDIIPCWYELGWIGYQGEKLAIVVRVHKDFIQNTPPLSANAPIVERLKQALDLNTLFDTFRGDFRGDFGFNRTFELTDEKGEFVEFLVHIPVINKPTGMSCQECAGTKKDRLCEDRECLRCDGKGEEYQIDWKLAHSISASFTVFTTISSHTEIETSCRLSQLLTFQTMTDRGHDGGSLGGDYSIPLVNWLRWLGRNRDTEVTAMIYAMKESHRTMLGELDRFDEHKFEAYVANEKGWLNVGCPGDRSSLHPADSWLREGRGYSFSSHNVDTPMQQLTLIAGLAALYEKARRDIALYGSG